MHKIAQAIFYVSLLLNVERASAQFSIQPLNPPAGNGIRSELWNVLLINATSEERAVRLEVTVQDLTSVQDVITGRTRSIPLKPGASAINMSALEPIQYTGLLASQSSLATSVILKVGTYRLCYTLTDDSEDNKSVYARECVGYEVQPLSPPQLIFPPDQSEQSVRSLQFNWIPPAPLEVFDQLTYTFLVTPIKGAVNATSAIQENTPLFTRTESQPSININPSTVAFEDGQFYAWQVLAYDRKQFAAKSEVWTFKYVNQTLQERVLASTPYLKLNGPIDQVATAPDGFLKLSYQRTSDDSVASIRISSSRNDKTIQIPLSLNRGENLWQVNLGRHLPLKDGVLYEAVFMVGNQHTRFSFKVWNVKK